MNANALGLLMALSKTRPIRLSSPVFPTPTATARIPKMKKTASCMYSLGDLVNGEDGEEIQHDGHKDVGRPQGEGLRAP